MLPKTTQAALLGSALALGCGGPPDGAAGGQPGQGRGGWFVDVTAELGLTCHFPPPVEGSYFMPDVMAGGCAFFDLEGDGDLDVYVVAGHRSADGLLTTPEGANRLFRQESDGTFVDVGQRSGAGHRGYGMGVAAGDYDNDGHVDLFITNYGRDRLLRNLGDGTFADVTEEVGLECDGWSTSAGFFDRDGDGFLDLFVTRYLEYDPGTVDADAAGKPEYPAPAAFPGLSDRLFRNEGGARFTDVSRESGIDAKVGRGLGVYLGDLNGDRRPDIYVCNDGEPNFAWIQGADGRFTEQAGRMGLAVNVFGHTEASMGVDRGDVDGDGEAELFLTHLDTETHTLYGLRAPGRYRDVTSAAGLGLSTQGFTGFGTAFGDLDLDGDLDLVCVNGHVLRKGAAQVPGLGAHWSPYAQANQIFLGDGAGRFAEASARGGALCAQVEVSRGLCLGDIDGDGDLDALVRNGNGTLRLYRNETAPAAWLVVRALDPSLGRDALGALVEVHCEAGVLAREITATRSYLSSADPRAHFGLAGLGSLQFLRIQWPDGSSETFEGGPTDVVRVLVRGEGR